MNLTEMQKNAISGWNTWYAERSASLLLIEWKKEHHVYENYSAVDGLGSSARQSDAFYHWGGLLGYVAVDSAGKLKGEQML